MALVYTQQDVLTALEIFRAAPDKTSIDRANSFLSDYQHSTEAWTLSNQLLLAPDTPQSVRLFAAQTFRTKIIYDLSQLDQQQILSLKDTLLSALDQFRAGPKAIQTQLCLAIAGLALQMPLWKDSVHSILQSFGRNPATVPALLEFLKVLPEEVNGNTKIPISDDDFRSMAQLLLSNNSVQVLELLTLYIQAPGVNADIQQQIFQCLRSWLNAGEVAASDISRTPLLGFAFEALSSDDLFDSSVDFICDFIHETQEIYDNEEVINVIMSNLIALRSHMNNAKEDSEKVRGYTRIFSEAGETYRQLVVQHPGSFYPLVEALLECAAYNDLDVVPITFHFWYRLAQSIGKQSTVSPKFLEAYRSLLTIIIGHLHFPPDPVTMTGQEADDFRSFRHVMGDTLKDCCYILGTDICLTKAYEMIAAVITRGNSDTAVSWQEVEAPLFAMRSMGGEIDVHDDQVVPRIMDLIPSLPTHPRIRYAAMLVISRYTEWINEHPSYIPFQLGYLSSGFDNPDSEVSAAAAQAMKYLCKDCKKHLIQSLPQLHVFVNTMGPKMSQDDKLQIYEAIAYIISYMPMEEAATSLRSFAFEIMSNVHDISSKPDGVTKQDLRQIADYLEQLETLLQIVDTFGEELPGSCRNAISETWALFDTLLRRYGSTYFITERITRVLRFGLQFFGHAALSIVPLVLGCLTTSYSDTGFSSCLWIAGKIVQRFGGEKDPLVRGAMQAMFEGMSAKVSQQLHTAESMRTLADVIEDHLQLSQAMIDCAPQLFFSSPACATAFLTAVEALTMMHPDIIFASLDFLRVMLSHEALYSSPSPTSSPEFALYASRVKEIITLYGRQLLGYLLSGVVGDFPDESLSAVMLVFRCLAQSWPSQLSSWLPPIVESLPASACPVDAKAKFMNECHNALVGQQPDKIKQAVTGLFRASRKVKERRELRTR